MKTATLVALVVALVVGFVARTASASGAGLCEALFSPSNAEQVGLLEQIAHLRLAADGARTRGDEGTAKIFYAQFKLAAQKARADGIDLTPLPSLVQRLQAAHAVKEEQESAREQKAIRSDDRSFQPMAPIHHMDSGGRVYSATLDKNQNIALTMGGPHSPSILWDLRTHQTIAVVNVDRNFAKRAILSSNGQTIFASIDGKAVTIEATTGKRIATLDQSQVRMFDGPPHMNAEGTRVISTTIGGSVGIWDAQTGALLHQLKRPGSTAMNAHVSPEGDRVLVSMGNSDVVVWDTSSGTLIKVLRGHKIGVFTVDYSPDRSKIVTGDANGIAIIWDAATGEKLHELDTGTSSLLYSAIFSPDGARIITGTENGVAMAWDVASGRTLFDLKGHRGGINDVTFNADGSLIATGSNDGSFTIWDARNGARLEHHIVGERVAGDAKKFSRDAIYRVFFLKDDASGKELLLTAGAGNSDSKNAFVIWSKPD